jgi:hypothetical protein
MQTPPIKKLDGSWARNNAQKALRSAEHLENIFQLNTAENNDVLSDVVLQDSVEIPLTSPAEVKSEIRTNMNPKKAPGYDLIIGQILIELPRKALVKLTNLINTSSPEVCTSTVEGGRGHHDSKTW